jgi:hypothetical protein
MQDAVLDHPSEDVLERFLFRNSSLDETEVIEDHIVGCGDCITRLEDLEDYAAVFRQASYELSRDARLQAERHAERRTRRLTPWRFAWASAAASLFIAISFVPGHLSHQNAASPIRVSVSAWRGVDIASVATGHPLDLRLNSTDLAAGAVVVQLVDSRGIEIWHGPASVRDESVTVSLPALSRQGNYFVRLYSVGSHNDTYGDLLREFGLRAK